MRRSSVGIFGTTVVVVVVLAACGGHSPHASVTTVTPSSPLAPTVTSAPSTTSAAAAGSLAPTTSAVIAIGDPCLVGRWVSRAISYDTPVAGTAGEHTTGEAGAVVIYTADGSETEDYTDSLPLVTTSKYVNQSVTLRGIVKWQVHASNGHYVQTGPPQPITVTTTNATGSHAATTMQNPASADYVCTATTLSPKGGAVSGVLDRS